MAMPLGWKRYFGFVCTPNHRTYHNAKRAGAFTVSYVRPTQIILASLAASPRVDGPGTKPILKFLPTFPAEVVDGMFLEDAYFFLECELERVIDGFGENSLITGRIVAAHVHAEARRESDEDDQELVARSPLLAYLQPDRFATIRESHAFPLPDHFQR